MEDREAYLIRSKEQAYEHLKNGDFETAYCSIMNDLKNHEELSEHMAIELGRILKDQGLLSNCHQTNIFIEGIS
jgi:hypothetical protein